MLCRYIILTINTFEHEADLKAKKFRPHLQRKGCKGQPLTSWERRGNRIRSKIRSRIEHFSVRCVNGQEMSFYDRLESKTWIAQPHIQHGEILHFEDANRIN